MSATATEITTMYCTVTCFHYAKHSIVDQTIVAIMLTHARPLRSTMSLRVINDLLIISPLNVCVAINRDSAEMRGGSMYIIAITRCPRAAVKVR